jgi:hypothetical protein
MFDHFYGSKLGSMTMDAVNHLTPGGDFTKPCPIMSCGD